MRKKLRFEKILLTALLCVFMLSCALAEDAQTSLADLDKEYAAEYGLFAYWPPEARAEYSTAAALDGKTCEDGKIYLMPEATDLSYDDALRTAYKEIGLDWDECLMTEDPFITGGGIVEEDGSRIWHITLTPAVRTDKDCTCYFSIDAAAGRMLSANYPTNAAKIAQTALDDFNTLYAEKSSEFEVLYGTAWWRWPLEKKAEFSNLSAELGWNDRGIVSSNLLIATPDATDLSAEDALYMGELKLAQHFTVSDGKIVLSSGETLTYAVGLSFYVQQNDSSVREYTVEFCARRDTDAEDDYPIYLGAVFISSPSGYVYHEEMNDESTLVFADEVDTDTEAAQLFEQYENDAAALYKAYNGIAGTPDQWTDEMRTYFYQSRLSSEDTPTQLETDPASIEYEEACSIAQNYMMFSLGAHRDANDDTVLTVLHTVTLWEISEDFQYYKIEYIAQTEDGSLSAVIERIYILRPALCAFQYEWLYDNFSSQMAAKRDEGKLNEAQFARLQYLLEYGDFFRWPAEIKASYTSFCKQCGTLPEDGLEYVTPEGEYDESLFAEKIESALGESGLEAYYNIGCGLVQTDAGKVWRIVLRPVSEGAENAECVFELDETTYEILNQTVPDGALSRAWEAWKADFSGEGTSSDQLYEAFFALYGSYGNWPLEARALYAERENIASEFPDVPTDVMPEADDIAQDAARAIADQAFLETFGETPDALTISGTQNTVQVQVAFLEIPNDPDTRYYQFTYAVVIGEIQLSLGSVSVSSPSGKIYENSLSVTDKEEFERRMGAQVGYLQLEQEKGMWCYWDYAEIKAYGEYIGLNTDLMQENAPENELQREDAIQIARDFLADNVTYVYPQAYYGVKEPEALTKERVDALKVCAIYYASSSDTASFWQIFLFEDEWLSLGFLDTFELDVDATTHEVVVIAEPGGNG